ncbi:DUF2059 domain-containing protein [Massilia sp. CCM 9210]|uniref:DUF2059 domain-containing protein n=1 Tax=Massilia scottii TaxID=3057166 RepID=UPI002796692D|nr:DUF2059 domain-containing protein [Massilia sp. CCM 9210]MDQ1817931.1 DUF2059 domain-containing protein [Massilia sp. CCM 9210]
MKKLTAVLCTALALVATPVFADKAAIDPATDKATRALLDSMGTRKMIKDSFEQMKATIPQMILSTATSVINANPRLTAAQKKAAIAEAAKKVPDAAARVQRAFEDPAVADEMIEAVVPLYATRFTVAEIEQIAAFYRSPVGAKMLAATPQIVNESMQIGQKIMLPRVNKIMQEAAADK